MFTSLLKKNIAYYGRKALIGFRDLRCSISPPTLNQPLFVVGCSRGGTTLVYKTFSESKELGTLHKETHDFWSSIHSPSERGWNTHEIPVEYASDHDRKYVSRYFFSQTGKSRIVDKNNQNGLSIDYLLRLFPDAHFVFIKRNPGDNINSLILGWAKTDEFGAWSHEVPEEIAIEQGKYKGWCFFLADGWRDYTHLSIQEVCAFQYRSMNEAILKSKRAVPESQWHELCYEDLIVDPVGGFRKVFDECHLSFDDHLERHCAEVIQRPYNAFSEIKIDKWKESAYREKIEEGLDLVRDTASKLGYG